MARGMSLKYMRLPPRFFFAFSNVNVRFSTRRNFRAIMQHRKGILRARYRALCNRLKQRVLSHRIVWMFDLAALSVLNLGAKSKDYARSLLPTTSMMPGSRSSASK